MQLMMYQKTTFLLSLNYSSKGVNFLYRMLLLEQAKDLGKCILLDTKRGLSKPDYFSFLIMPMVIKKLDF